MRKQYRKNNYYRNLDWEKARLRPAHCKGYDEQLILLYFIVNMSFSAVQDK